MVGHAGLNISPGPTRIGLAPAPSLTSGGVAVHDDDPASREAEAKFVLGMAIAA